MAFLLAISHVRRVDTLGKLLNLGSHVHGPTSSVSGGSKLTFACPRHEVHMNRHRKFVAQATIQMPGRLTKREKNEDEWEKTPFQQFKANFATLLPAGPNTESYASIIVDILSFFWLYGVPWMVLIVGAITYPIFFYDRYHYNRIQKKKITKMAEEWLEVEKDQ